MYKYTQNEMYSTHKIICKSIKINIQLPNNAKKEDTIDNKSDFKMHEYMGYDLGRFDPNHISNTPPNNFIDTLKKRIDIYYNECQ